ERGNVMGPQPIAPIVEPPAEMFAAADRLLNALMRGDRATVEEMTPAHVRDEMMQIANAIPANRYDKFELIGRARVSQHYFLKAKLTGTGVEPFKFQFRLGETDGKWTVREALNLTGRRSAWTR
ncbi:MAG TPA: hypothetical protein VGR40_02985, partial [Candidatus Binatus sp.]|nr:hypothetical protein [Candidatus Binatus sp.]